jgi:hypothetical protein
VEALEGAVLLLLVGGDVVLGVEGGAGNYGAGFVGAAGAKVKVELAVGVVVEVELGVEVEFKAGIECFKYLTPCGRAVALKILKVSLKK